MNAPQTPVAESPSRRRYELSPGGTIWKNTQLSGDRSEISDFSFEPISLSTTEEFSWDLSTDSSDEDMTRPSKQRHIASRGSQKHAASGASFKTASISKTTAATENTSIDRVATSKSSRKQQSVPNSSGTAFAFLEWFCCGVDTTEEPKQERKQDLSDSFLGKIITCHIITCNCEGCSGCVGHPGDHHDSEDVAQ